MINIIHSNISFLIGLKFFITSLRWPNLENVCNIWKNVINSTGYCQKNGVQLRSLGEKAEGRYFAQVIFHRSECRSPCYRYRTEVPPSPIPYPKWCFWSRGNYLVYLTINKTVSCKIMKPLQGRVLAWLLWWSRIAEKAENFAHFAKKK